MNYEIFPFYRKLSEEQKTLFKDSVIKKEMAQGQMLMGGDPRFTGIPMVLKGRLRVFRISEKGREMTINRILVGEVCVMAAVCFAGHEKYNFSLEAELDSTMLIVPPNIFGELMHDNGDFSDYVLRMLAKKLLQSIDTIEMLIFVSIEDRIMEYLKENANELGEVITTHEKMAVELGSSREVISRQLKKMAGKGWLTLKRGKIILNNHE